MYRQQWRGENSKRCHVNTVFCCYMHVYLKLIFSPVKLLLFRFSRILSWKVTERVPRKLDLNLESLSRFSDDFAACVIDWLALDTNWARQLDLGKNRNEKFGKWSSAGFYLFHSRTQTQMDFNKSLLRKNMLISKFTINGSRILNILWFELSWIAESLSFLLQYKMIKRSQNWTLT